MTPYHPLLLPLTVADPGGAESAAAPLFSADFFFFFFPSFFLSSFFRGFFFFFACHPGGRSGRRMVPLHNNVNDAKKISEKDVSESPPPPPPQWATFSGLARHRGIWIPGPPFSQILDPPLINAYLRAKFLAPHTHVFMVSVSATGFFPVVRLVNSLPKYFLNFSCDIEFKFTLLNILIWY